MKYEKLVYVMTATIIVVGSIMKIIHYPGGNALVIFGLIGFCFFQTIQVNTLKRKLRDSKLNVFTHKGIIMVILLVILGSI